jgi:uncharacterized protein YyaL (SSP411 family)
MRSRISRPALGSRVTWILLATAGVAGIGWLADDRPNTGRTGMSTTKPVSTNRLSQATSPYLQQHAHNPVDWYEWGPEALARARAEDKPIFLSIGYAACHWCHVMAHESFEDPAIAAVMNEHFINIKVDREERPDLDEIYMQATLVLTRGQGGWPMSVWLTPDLKPFFAGTYFPPTARHGRAGFREVCAAISRAWREQRDEIITQADKLGEVVQHQLRAAPAGDDALTLADLDETAEKLAGAFDTVSGGLVSGQTNKFPPSMALDVLLRSAVHRQPGAARQRHFIELVELTLDQMARGGIYDQLAGGFHRYSTDLQWLVPHFEKMLYDQALVSRIYLDAWQLTGKKLYARVARETFEYVLADLRAPEGGFYSSRDADSEGQEGKYYVWTRTEVLEILGPELGELVCAHCDIREDGNWQDPHEPDVPKNILHVRRDAGCCAKFFNMEPDAFCTELNEARARLLAARDKRVAPGLDDKILCEWNGLMISSLARGGSVLDEPRYVEAARQAAAFILAKLRVDGRLQRSYRAGQTVETAFISDYGALIEGLIELYEATFEQRWLDEAVALTRVALEHFWDTEHGAFFFTAHDHEQLIARSKDVRDGAVPSGNSLMLMNLARLAVMTGDKQFQARADEMLTGLAGEVQASPWASERFLAGVDFALSGPLELAVVGDPDDAATQALLRTIHSRYLPNRVIMLHNPAAPAASVDAPLLKGRTLVGGKPAVYICENYTCRQPVMTPAELEHALPRLDLSSTAE